MLFTVIIPTLNEEENIEKLIRSINSQSYPQKEVIVVDDGSKDNTIAIVRALATELNSPGFQLTLLKTSDYGSIRGPSIARNIGIKESKGDFIYLADADFLFIQNDFLDKLSRSLQKGPVAMFRSKVIIDNWLEYNQAVDYGSLSYHGISYAFTKKIIGDRAYDPALGAGEDKDLLGRLRKEGLLENAILPGVEVGLHYPHSIKKYQSERLWHGKSFWSYLRKYPTLGNYLTLIVRPFPILDLILGVVLLFVYPLIGFSLLVIFLGLAGFLFYKSSVKTLSRLSYILFRMTFGTFWFSVGLLKGLADKLLRIYQPGRDS